MENHGITMKGKYYCEVVTSPTFTTVARFAYDTTNKRLVFGDGSSNVRVFDHKHNMIPDGDLTRTVGDATHKYNFYGQVRYS